MPEDQRVSDNISESAGRTHSGGSLPAGGAGAPVGPPAPPPGLGGAATAAGRSRGSPPVEVHQSLQKAFSGIPVHALSVVNKINSKGKKDKRVLVATRGAVMLCTEFGTVKRAIQYAEIEEVITQGAGPQMQVLFCLQKVGDEEAAEPDVVVEFTADKRNAHTDPTDALAAILALAPPGVATRKERGDGGLAGLASRRGRKKTKPKEIRKRMQDFKDLQEKTPTEPEGKPEGEELKCLTPYESVLGQEETPWAGKSPTTAAEDVPLPLSPQDPPDPSKPDWDAGSTSIHEADWDAGSTTSSSDNTQQPPPEPPPPPPPPPPQRSVRKVRVAPPPPAEKPRPPPETPASLTPAHAPGALSSLEQNNRPNVALPPAVTALDFQAMVVDAPARACARAASRIATAAALRRSDSICTAKQASQCVTDMVRCDLPAVAERIQRMWHAAKGDVVDELRRNVVAPLGIVDPMVPLAEAARAVERGAEGAYPGRNRAELLVMALYTMAGPDIDALMSFSQVPTYTDDDGSRAAWESYCREKSPSRNGAIFSTINWAMRTCPSEHNLTSDEAQAGQAWSCVRKWVKYICLLHALCIRSQRGGAELSRGLAGLPEAVMRAHSALRPGDRIDWPAPSSGSVDPAAAEAYVQGAAANATKTGGGAAFFGLRGVVRGLPLQAVSKYPKEAEVLIPPLSSFVVQAAESGWDPDKDGFGALRFGLEWQGADALDDAFIDEVLADATRGADRLCALSDAIREIPAAADAGEASPAPLSAHTSPPAGRRSWEDWNTGRRWADWTPPARRYADRARDVHSVTSARARAGEAWWALTSAGAAPPAWPPPALAPQPVVYTGGAAGLRAQPVQLSPRRERSPQRERLPLPLSGLGELPVRGAPQRPPRSPPRYAY